MNFFNWISIGFSSSSSSFDKGPSVSVSYQAIEKQQVSTKKGFKIRLIMLVEGATNLDFSFPSIDVQEMAKNGIMKKVCAYLAGGKLAKFLFFLFILWPQLGAVKQLAAAKQKTADGKTGNSEQTEIRKRILLANEELRKIHKSLVFDNNFLDEDEFWSLHRVRSLLFESD